MKTALGGALALGVTLAVLPAQQTWVVNPNGTGNFTDLAVAIATVSAGDTLLLTGGGNYTGGYLLDKALHIIGDPAQRPTIGVLSHAYSAVGTLASFRHLDAARIDVRVPSLLEDVTCDSVLVAATASLLDCDLGNPAHYATLAAVAVYGADVAVHRCTIRGNRAFFWQTLYCHMFWGRAFWMSGGNAIISDSTIEGADSMWLSCSQPGWSPAGPAIDAYAATVRVTQSTLRGGADQNSVRVDPILLASGASLLRDPSVASIPASTQGGYTFIPATDAQSAPPGGTILCQAKTGPNLPAVIVAGLGLRIPVATPYGGAWIDPAANVILRIGFTDSSGVMNAVIALPPTAPKSLPITVQCLAVPTATGNLAIGAPVVVQVL